MENEKIITEIENILERNLLMRDEDTETVSKIIQLFKNSNRTQLKWHFKNEKVQRDLRRPCVGCEKD